MSASASPFEWPVGLGAREVEHPLALRDGLLDSRGAQKNLAAALVDLRTAEAGERRHGLGDLERARVPREGGGVGVGILGPVAGVHEVLEGLRPVLPLGEVMRQLFVVLGQPIGIELLDRGPDGAVQLPAPLLQQAVVGDVLDHGMLEDVGRFREKALLVDDLESLELLQEALERPAEAGDALQEPLEELPANDRSQLDGTLAVIAEAVESRHDDPLDRVGHADLGHSFDHAVAAVLPRQHPEVEEGLCHLLHEKRHAFSLVQQRRLELLGELVRAQHQASHVQRLGLGERVQGERGVEAAVPKGGLYPTR